MKYRWYLPLMALILAAAACNWSEVAPPAAPEIEASPLPTFAISTLTPIPTETLLPTPTSTPAVPVAWPKNEGINCRYGPGQEWEAVSIILPETVTQIKGRTVNTAWWYVIDPTKIEQSFCWVAYDVVDTAGNLNIVPLVEPPPATVTDAVLDSVEVTFSACEGENRVLLNGTVKANGPLTVTYRWEVSGADQETSDEKTLTFSRSGSNSVTAEMVLSDCGDYTAALRVTEPSEMLAQKTFRIQSP
jgi:hypothetical protein